PASQSFQNRHRSPALPALHAPLFHFSGVDSFPFRLKTGKPPTFHGGSGGPVSSKAIQLLQSQRYRFLLRFFFGAARPPAQPPSVQVNLRHEVTIVGRPPLIDNAVSQGTGPLLLDNLLKSRFGVDDPGQPILVDSGKDDLLKKPPRSLQPLVQVEGTDKGLKKVRQEGRALATAGHFLPLTQPDKLTKTQLFGKLGQGRLANHPRPHPGQFP